MIILNEKLVFLNENYFNWTIFCVFAIIGILIGVVISLLVIVPEPVFDKGEKILMTCAILLVTGLGGMGIGAISANKVCTIASKRQYDIYLTDMTYEELVDSPAYTIVDTVGKRIIIEDKEWQYYEGYEK